MSEQTPAEATAQVIPITVARGTATPEEVAALIAVLAAGSAADEPAPRHTSVWASRERLVRAPHVHGRGAWRASAWPR
ncbi:MAG: acyl-CoA carboxylase epsilon subunit [Candidatus Limnocylindrales bacterium]